MKAKTALLFTLFFFAFAATALAEKKTTFSNRWPFNAAKAVATDSTHLFLGLGNIIRVYDKNTLAIDHTDIAIETSEGITGLYYDSATGYLFVTSGHSGLYRIDTNNLEITPTNYIVKGKDYSEYSDDNSKTDLILPTSRGVHLSGGNAYVAYTKVIPNSTVMSGVEIVNASGSGAMSRRGAADLPGGFVTFTEARGIAVSGSNAYVADYVNGLMKFDVSNPVNPQGTYWAATLTGLDIMISGDHAFMAGGSYGLWIAALADKDWKIDPYENYNGIMKYTDGTDVLDNNSKTINNPAMAASIALSDNFAYAYIIDSLTPDGLSYMKTIDSGWKPSKDNQGNDKQIRNVESGLRIINIVNKEAPVLEGVYNSAIADAYSVCNSSSSIYMVDHETGITKLDATTPASPVSLATQSDLPANCNKFYLYQESHTNDTNLYVYSLESVGLNNSLRILQFAQVGGILNTEFSNINMQSHTTLPGEARDVFVREVNESGLYHVYAFIADGSNGLLIYNVDDKKHISSRLNTSTLADQGLNQAQAIDTAGSLVKYIFVADGTNGVRSINVENKANPVIKGEPARISGTAKDLFDTGNYIYVAAGSAGLQVIDSSDKENLRVTGGIDTPGDAKAVAIWGNYAFVADGAEGVQIIDIQNPINPSIKTTFRTTDACGIWVSQPAGSLNPSQKTYAYIADGTGGVITIDVTAPLSPTEVTGWAYNTVGNSTEIAVNEPGTNAIVADNKGGLTVLAFSDTQATTPSTGSSPELSDNCFITTIF